MELFLSILGPAVVIFLALGITVLYLWGIDK